MPKTIPIIILEAFFIKNCDKCFRNIITNALGGHCSVGLENIKIEDNKCLQRQVSLCDFCGKEKMPGCHCSCEGARVLDRLDIHPIMGLKHFDKYKAEYEALRNKIIEVYSK